MVEKFFFLLLIVLGLLIVLTHQPPAEAQVSTMIGSQANLWEEAEIPATAASIPFDTRGFPNCSVFGHTGSLTDIYVQHSADDINYYSGELYTLANGDFSIHSIIASKFIRLYAESSTVITAMIQCKL